MPNISTRRGPTAPSPFAPEGVTVPASTGRQGNTAASPFVPAEVPELSEVDPEEVVQAKPSRRGRAKAEVDPEATEAEVAPE